MWSLLILFFILAIAVSFLCSVWEAVLLSVTHPYVQNLEDSGSKAGKLLRRLKEDINRPLTSILTLNTIAHTAGAMGVAAQVKVLANDGLIEGIAAGIMTIAILVFSEIVPKNLGAHYWRAWAPWVAHALTWICVPLKPAVWLAGKITIGKGHHTGTFTREEFAAMADIGTQEGKLEDSETRILKNLFRFQHSFVYDIMTPRVVVFALRQDSTVEEFFTSHVNTPFSRIPIYGENRDDISGFVLKSDLLLAQAKGQGSKPLSGLKRPIQSVHETMSVADVFDKFITTREHIFLVLDEYGGLQGLVTLEDVVETLLGLEIVDEADRIEDLQTLARKLWQKRAERMGIELEVEEGSEGG